jgi:hypothetical protein
MTDDQIKSIQSILLGSTLSDIVLFMNTEIKSGNDNIGVVKSDVVVSEIPTTPTTTTYNNIFRVGPVIDRELSK